MFFTIYKTTNIINGKYYIGKHQTKNLDDGYMGSGKLIKRAIAKYGIENFHKEVLHICSTEKQMNILEKILVVPDVELNYNLCPGGKGGWGYVNTNDLSNTEKKRKAAAKNVRNNFNHWIAKPKNKKIMQKSIKSASLIRQEKYPEGTFKNKKHSSETKSKIGNANKGNTPWNKGKEMSAETKEKIRLSILNKRIIPQKPSMVHGLAC